MDKTASRVTAYLTFGVLSLWALAATAVTSLTTGAPFRPFFGPIPPLLGVATLAALGAVALSYLNHHSRLRIWSCAWNSRALLALALLAAILTIPPILVDLYVGFPRELNVPPPAALAFYPAIAFVAEIVFHVLPLACLVLLLRLVAKRQPTDGTMLVCLICVAPLEPAFQALFVPLGAHAAHLTWFIGPHVLLVNLAALWAFWRLDFVALYGFRLLYYLFWHVLWGQWRLHEGV